ncbi:ribulose-phosphate 3-epimerase [Lachnospiraceae bacterium PF1-21]|uniref:ribulose-phosphate 3-epimerase n=1 Tax=Ohessyouella blattaphilus TaxID=2949333 RepID=UPI00255F01B0|nr:ribulose-phosphate 3-epimerase [Lachnospiraceae bacterium OttesenSCG-928-J05]
MKIIPSIISGNLLAIGEEMERTKAIGAMHIDVEDGNFSTGITVGLDMVAAIAAKTHASMDVHLVVTNPADYIEVLCDLGVTGIGVHIEGAVFPSKLLGMIKNRGVRAGLAVTLKTPIEMVLPFVDMLDYVLILTNEQDHQGLKFREWSYEKIEKARKLLPKDIEVWADGGIKEDILPKVARAGADHVIIGRALMSAKDPYAECLRLEGLCKDWSI